MAPNRTRIVNKRQKVHRTKTRDRRRGYITPSKTEDLCPNFEHTWAYFKDQGFFPDFVAACNLHDADCDYRNTIVDDVFSLCHRYIKRNNEGFTELPPPADESGDRQKINLQYKMKRLWKEKEATIQMSVARWQIENRYLLNNTNDYKEINMDPSGTDYYNPVSGNGYTPNHNSGYLTGYYIKGMEDESDYSFQFQFTPTSEDDDSIVAVFRYNPDTGHYYSVEWNNGGLSPKGLSVKRHICINKEKKQYTVDTLFSVDLRWTPSRYNYMYITVDRNKVTVRIRRYEYIDGRYWYPDHNHYHGYWYWDWRQYTYTVNLSSDSRLSKGTYGIGTISQPNVRIHGFYGHTRVISGTHTYTRKTPLIKGAAYNQGYLLSSSMNDIFAKDIQSYLSLYGLNRNEVVNEKYTVLFDNVTEPVIFESGSTTTTDADDKLYINSWDYDKDVVYLKEITVSDHDNHVIKDVYTVAKDLYIEFVQVLFSKIRLDDGFDLFAHYREVLSANVMKPLYKTDYEEDPKYLGTGSSVEFIYEVKRDPILMYHNENHIDTHDKIFKIKNNELHWHLEPSRVRLDEYE